MKLVRFLAKAYHADRLMEPGEEVLVDSSTILSPHMLDVATGETGEKQPAVAQVVYREDLAYGHADLSHPATEEEARAFGDKIGGVAGAVINHLWEHIDHLKRRIADLEAAQTPVGDPPAAETEHQPETPPAA